MTLPQKGNIRMLFDAIEEIELDAALERGTVVSEQEQSFRLAKVRLLHTLNNPPTLNPENDHRLFGRWISNYSIKYSGSCTEWKTPWGWRLQRCYARELFRMMPLWLWAIVVGWERRYAVYRPFIRLGFLIGPKAGYYADFRWSWRFWRSQRVLLGPVTWYQQLCYWLLQKEAEYYRDCPRPFTQIPWGVTSITLTDIPLFQSGDIIMFSGQGKAVTATVKDVFGTLINIVT